MLTLFLKVLPAPFTGVASPFGWGNAVVGAGVGGFRFIDGARRLLRGVVGLVAIPEGRGIPGTGLEDGDEGATSVPPVLFRDFETGKAGKAIFGGPFDGREGRGRVVAILVVSIYICASVEFVASCGAAWLYVNAEPKQTEVVTQKSNESMNGFVNEENVGQSWKPGYIGSSRRGKTTAAKKETKSEPAADLFNNDRLAPRRDYGRMSY